MNMKKILGIIWVVLLAHTCFSQKSPSKKIHFTSINNVGLLFGEQDNCFNIQSINGISTKNNFVFAIGIGFDSYIVKSIPVFLDVRKYFGQKKIQPFIFGDIGRSFNLYDNNFPKASSNSNAGYTFNRSAYYELGAGITKKISPTLKIFTSIGCSFKEFNYSTSTYVYPWSSLYSLTNPSYENYAFTFQRLSVKIGLAF